MIAGFEGVANFLVAYSASEEAEFGLDIVDLLAFSAVILIGIAWDLLFAVAVGANGSSKLIQRYTGGTKGYFFLLPWR